MPPLKDVMNKVSRLITPELRREDEIVRLKAEIDLCAAFMAQRALNERVLMSWAENEAGLRAAAARMEAALPDMGVLHKHVQDIAEACKHIDSVVGYQNAPLHDFCRKVGMDLLFVRSGHLISDDEGMRRLGMRLLADTARIDAMKNRWEEEKAVLSAFRSDLDDLRQGGGAGGKLAQHLFFRQVQIGTRTERRLGYPIIFLTEKVEVPVIKRFEMDSSEKKRVIDALESAVDTLEQSMPALYAMARQVGSSMTTIEALQQSERAAVNARKELAQVPADFARRTESHMKELAQRLGTLKGGPA